jgi:hypothetical protein
MKLAVIMQEELSELSIWPDKISNRYDVHCIQTIPSSNLEISYFDEDFTKNISNIIWREKNNVSIILSCTRYQIFVR